MDDVKMSISEKKIENQRTAEDAIQEDVSEDIESTDSEVMDDIGCLSGFLCVTLKNDLKTIHQYVDAGFQKIMNGEIGRYEGARYE